MYILFHVFIISLSSFHGFITSQLNDLLPVGLLAQFCRALCWFKGQGLESCTSPFFFSGSLFATAEVASTTVMISFYLILDPAVHLYSYFIVLHLLEFPLAGMIFRTYFNCAITYFLNWMKYLL